MTNEDKMREEAVARVLKIRGSYDAPGFDACVEEEIASQKVYRNLLNENVPQAATTRRDNKAFFMPEVER